MGLNAPFCFSRQATYNLKQVGCIFSRDYYRKFQRNQTKHDHYKFLGLSDIK